MARWSLLAARGLLTLGLSLAVGSTIASCLADLDPPLVCPAPAHFAGNECLNSLVSAPGQCLSRQEVACLTGPRASCACDASECPAATARCFPAGDCPPAVTSAVAGAICMPVAEADVGRDDPDPTRCVCGCPRCMSVCDGLGPVIGFYDQGGPNLTYLPPIIALDRALPEQGRIGFYVRLRGLVAAAVVLVHWEPPADPVQLTNPPYFLTAPIGTDFVEQVYYQNKFLHQEPYAWSTPETKPTHLVFVSTAADGAPALSLFEVDCVVPFLAP